MPRWLIWSVLTILAWGVWAVLNKTLAGYTAAQNQALSTLGILPIMAAVLATPGFRIHERRRTGVAYAFAAGVLACFGNLAFYQAQAAGEKASIAVALTDLYPLVTVALAFLLLREKPSGVQLLGVAGSLGAIYLLSVGPQGFRLTEGTLYALAPIVLWGAAGLVTKLSAQHVSAELATFWFLASFLPFSLVIFVTREMNWSLTGRDWLMVALLGFTYGLGNMTVLFAYRQGGKASVVTPLCSLYPLVTIPLAIVLFGEKIETHQWAGIALALASAVALAIEKSPPVERKETNNADLLSPASP